MTEGIENSAAANGGGGENAEAEFAPTRWPKLKLRWHESWIIRGAAIASLVLFCGYATSAFFAVQSIDSIARLAHDDAVDKALAEHLDSIKEVRRLQQAIVIERLKPDVAAWLSRHASSRQKHGQAPRQRPEQAHLSIDSEEIRRWVRQANLAGVLDIPPAQIISELTIAALHATADASDLKSPLLWLDRDRLKIINDVIEFPKGPVYTAFKAAEDVRQRYQLIGAKLDENIRPTLIRTNSVILLVCFVLLASLFIAYAQRFKRRLSEVIEGFSFWSEKDPDFRFEDGYQGELKLVTEQFNAMADDVEANRQKSLYLEKIASWQIIARKLAHEIKNPLTPIQMMVSQLKRRYKGEDEAFAKLLDDAQHIITEEVAGLRRMVDNFSNFARLPMPEPKPADLVPLCRHAVELEKTVFPQHTLSFSSDLKRASAVFDEDLIRQVLLNLIKNAGEACGENPSVIAVSLVETAAEYILRVHDNGPGIAPDLQNRIFEAYFTTKHTGPTPGMGLGLAVCQKIVLDHGGKLTVQSRPGDTTFSIRLPKRKKDGYTD